MLQRCQLPLRDFGFLAQRHLCIGRRGGKGLPFLFTRPIVHEHAEPVAPGLHERLDFDIGFEFTTVGAALPSAPASDAAGVGAGEQLRESLVARFEREELRSARSDNVLRHPAELALRTRPPIGHAPVRIEKND